MLRRRAASQLSSTQHKYTTRSRMPSAPRHGGRGALLAALLASALLATGAQPASPGGGSDAADAAQDQQVSTAMVALLAAVVAVFVFIAASTICLRHCSGRLPPHDGDGGRAVAVAPSSLDAFFSSRSWWQRRRGRRPRGLDAEAFPTMTYAEAKALRVGNKGGGDDGGALECAVCLCEFEDGDRLRLLLPRCCHAFHPDCIAEWLSGHVTCPVCRCNLQPDTASSKDDTGSDSEEPTSFPSIPPVASSVSSETAAAWQRAGPLPVAVVIDVVTEEEEEARRQEALDLQRIGTQRRAMRRSPSGHRSPAAAPQLAARLDRDLERFTLRLPEHVREEMVAAAAAARSSQLRRGRRRRAAEGISAPLVGRMGRWQSLLGRTFSGRLSFFSASRVTGSFEGGEVSSSSSSFYTRLRGKRVAAVDAAADDVPAEGSIRLDRVGVGGSGSGAKASSEVAAAAADEEKART